jgi:hypothetical protein
MQLLPMQYHLEVYERSYVNDPSLSVRSSTPTPSFAVGDVINPRSENANWSEPPKRGEMFRVVEVRHFFWAIPDSHVGHKLMLRVEAVPVAE